MEKSSRKWRWMPLVLGLSLALNLLVAGAVVGAFWHHDGSQGRSHGAGFAGPYIHALDSEDRRSLRETAREREPQNVPRRARYDTMIKVLRADPFDRAAAATALAEQQASVLSRQDALRAAWLDRIAAMDTADRAAYVARLEALIAQPRGNKRHK